MTALEAVNLSIAHWERMIAWVKTNAPSDIDGHDEVDRDEVEIAYSMADLMHDQIYECWYASDCALCRHAGFNDDGDTDCTMCALAVSMDIECGLPGSPWHHVHSSNTWADWLIAAETLMLPALWRCKSEIEEVDCHASTEI